MKTFTSGTREQLDKADGKETNDGRVERRP